MSTTTTTPLPSLEDNNFVPEQIPTQQTKVEPLNEEVNPEQSIKSYQTEQSVANQMNLADYINIWLSDSDKQIALPYYTKLTPQSTISISDVRQALVKQYGLSPRLKLLFNGKILPNNEDMKIEEIGIKAGDTLAVLNHRIASNYIQESLTERQLKTNTVKVSQLLGGATKPQQAAPKQSKKRSWNEYMRIQEGDSSSCEEMQHHSANSYKRFKDQQGSDTLVKQEKFSLHAKDFTITPQLIAQITGAKEILEMKPSPKKGDAILGIFQQALGERTGTQIMNVASSIRSTLQNEAEPTLVRQLIDMGFPDERARRVLLHFRNDQEMALDYLFHTPPEHDAAILVRQNSGHQFQVNEDYVGTLMEFGYPREDAIYALRINANNIDLACSFLMSNPNPVSGQNYRGQQRRSNNPPQLVRSRPPELAEPMIPDHIDAHYQYVIRPTGANRPLEESVSQSEVEEDQEESEEVKEIDQPVQQYQQIHIDVDEDYHVETEPSLEHQLPQEPNSQESLPQNDFTLRHSLPTIYEAYLRQLHGDSIPPNLNLDNNNSNQEEDN